MYVYIYIYIHTHTHTPFGGLKPLRVRLACSRAPDNQFVISVLFTCLFMSVDFLFSCLNVSVVCIVCFMRCFNYADCISCLKKRVVLIVFVGVRLFMFIYCVLCSSHGKSWGSARKKRPQRVHSEGRLCLRSRCLQYKYYVYYYYYY